MLVLEVVLEVINESSRIAFSFSRIYIPLVYCPGIKHCNPAISSSK